MNTKTTLFLAFGLLGLLLLYYIVQSRPTAAETPSASAAAPKASAATRDLLPTKLGDVVKVSYRRRGGDEWLFEKGSQETSPGQSNWKMVKPVEMPCVAWEVDKFGRMLGALQYEISYRPGEAGAISPAEAGLDPPEAVVTLTDGAGKSASVDVGRPGPNNGTYVRLGGTDAICLGKSDLKELLKNKTIDYRDKQLWTFENGNVARVEIEDRSRSDAPVTYVFGRDGARWMMQSPVAARATNKVDDALTAMNLLRVMQWHDDDPAKLKVYGLDPASWTVRVTVEEPIKDEKKPEESKDGEEESEEPKPVEPPPKKIVVYELQLSDVSPIGEDTKVYVRAGGGNAVGSLMKSTVDKLKPTMNEWREMRLTTAPVQDATRIELKTRDGRSTLVKKNGGWAYEDAGSPAESSAVSELLKAIGNLTAVSFTDDEPVDPAAAGFGDPQAEIVLTIPGIEGPEKIALGGYTDETTKRLLYARRNDLPSVAKVRAADVAKLTLNPSTYRERAIVDVVPARIQRLVISYDNAFVPGRETAEFQRKDGQWKMVAPVTAEIRQDAFNKLLETVGGLRGEGIVADASAASAYGLEVGGSAVGVLVEYQLVGETGADSAENRPEAPAQFVAFAASQHEGNYYAMRQDGESIYSIKKDAYQQLLAEYRTDRVLDFDEKKVRKFSIRHGEQKLGFEKKGDRWVCDAEPDLPLDSKKVQNALVQIRDLRTQRYVRNAAADLTPFGLASPGREVAITLDDGKEIGLMVADSLAQGGGERGHFAVTRDSNDVLLLATDSLSKLDISVAALE